MDEKLWSFIDSTGTWLSKSYGMPTMAGRALGWLLVCDPAEQTAADLAEALEASKGAISGATGWLVRTKLAERIHIRGERADRFRVRGEAWAEQIHDLAPMKEVRALLAAGLEALAEEPASRRARLEEIDLLYAWFESRMPSLWEEWLAYKRATREGEEHDLGQGHARR